MDQQTSVQLDTSGWYEFFLNRVGDADVQIPNISITDVQYLDPITRAPLDITNIQPGQSILIHVDVNNAAAPTPLIASLALDSDTDHTSVIYDSHLTTPVSQDIQVVCPWGASSFEWTWTVPATAPAGQYYSLVTFNVQVVLPASLTITSQASVASSSIAAPATTPSSASPVVAAAGVVQRNTSTTSRPAATVGQTLLQNTLQNGKTSTPLATSVMSAHDLALMDLLRTWRVTVPTA
jgi:hypothetical protein